MYTKSSWGKKYLVRNQLQTTWRRERGSSLFTKIDISFIFQSAARLCLTSSLVCKQLVTTGDTQGVQTCRHIFCFTSITVDTFWQKLHQIKDGAICMQNICLKQVVPPSQHCWWDSSATYIQRLQPSLGKTIVNQNQIDIVVSMKMMWCYCSGAESPKAPPISKGKNCGLERH